MVSHRTKHFLTYDLAIVFFGIFNEIKTHPHKNLNMDVYRSLIHNCQNLETTRMSFAAAASAKSLQLCPTLCDPIDGSPPDFPAPGILQARTLEWVAISFSKDVL